MPQTDWRTVRVFISSTFRDMQAERDHLVRFVFPRLREDLLKWRIHLADIDLRWGVTSEQDTLEVCREIIDECRPRFICMLGGRYGWTPPDQEHSITADEVRYAVLDQPDKKGYHFFYFRDPNVTESMVETTPGEYREPEGSENHRKLEVLKQAIIDAQLKPFVYPARWDANTHRLVDLKEFGDGVYADIMESIYQEFGAESAEPLDEFAEQRAAMESFIEERTAGYVVGSRQEILERLFTHAEGAGKNGYLCLTGEPGSGKSALLAHFCKTYRDAHPNYLVIPHFVGASEGSTDVRRLLRRLCRELLSDDDIPEDYEELRKAFPEFLAKVGDSGHVVILVDAINQLDQSNNAHSMRWLPDELPPNVWIILSALPSPPLDALMDRRQPPVAVLLDVLKPADAQEIIEEYRKRYRKNLADDQRDLLLAKGDAGKPLYLLTALEELRTLGTYEEITRRIADLPEDTQSLFLWILKRLEDDDIFRDASGVRIGEALVRQMVSCLGVSRNGLSQSELIEIIAPDDPQGNIAALLHLLRPYLMHRGELLDFYHSQLRSAVEVEYLNEKHERLNAHRTLADYFGRKADPAGDLTWTGDYVHGLSDLPYHQTEGNSLDSLEATLTSLNFVVMKSRSGMVYDLVLDYDRVGAGRSALEPLIRTAVSHGGDMGINCPHCITMQRVDARSLGDLVKCCTCGRMLRVNPFAIIRPWNTECREHAIPSSMGCTSECAQAIREFADFVAGELNLLAAYPELAYQQAMNTSRDSSVAHAARKLRSAGKGPRIWLRRLSETDVPKLCILSCTSAVGAMSTCAWSPDGRFIAWGAAAGEAGIVEAQGGRQVVSFNSHIGRITSCSWSPDARFVLTSSEDGTARIWNARNGLEVSVLQEGGVAINCATWSPDGSMVLCGSDDCIASIWDIRSSAIVGKLVGHSGAVNACAWSPDAQMLLTGSRDKTWRMWDRIDLTTIRELQTYSTVPTACGWSPDGSQVVCGCDDTIDNVMIFDVATGAKKAVIRGNSGMVSACVYSPDGKSIACASSNGSLAIRDADGKIVMILQGHSQAVDDCNWSPDGRLLVSVAESEMKVWDTTQRDHHTIMSILDHGHSHNLSCCDWSADGQRILAGSTDGRLTLMGPTGSLLPGVTWQAKPYDHSPIYSCSLSPQGDRAVSGGGVRVFPGQVEMWNADTSLWPLFSLDGHQYGVLSCALSPNGRWIASGGYDAVVMVWDTDNPKHPKSVLRGHLSEVRCCSWSPDGRWIASTSGDKTVRVWDALRCRESMIYQAHKTWVLTCAWSPDCQHIVSADYGGVVSIWDPRTGSEVHSLMGHAGSVLACDWSNDGQLLATVSDDRTLRVWEWRTGKMVGLFFAPDGLRTVRFSPDARHIAIVTNGEGITVFSLDGYDVSAPYVTARRLWTGSDQSTKHGRWDKALNAPCPYCGRWFTVSSLRSASDTVCCNCSAKLRVSQFAVDERRRWWQLWMRR